MCKNTDLLWTSCTDLYHTVKTLANKDCRKFGGKNFDELKSICIGNVMEIVKIGKKLGVMLYFAKFTKVFSPPMFFTVWYFMVILDLHFVDANLWI